MRTGSRRPLVAMVMAVAVLGSTAAGATGCTAAPAGSPPTAGTGPSRTAPAVSPSPTRSPFPSAPPTDPAVVFAADGIAGYAIGADLSDLRTRGLVTGVVATPLCLDTMQAAATGVYAGKLALTFRSGALIAIRTTAPGLVTPSGVRVGASLSELESTYGNRGALIGAKAFSVRVPASTLGLVFSLDPAGTSVVGISVGEAHAIENAVGTGQIC